MTEPELVRKIKKALIAEGAYAAKIHGGQFSVGIPDLLVCYDGAFFGFEVKLPGKEKKVTELQMMNLREIRSSEGIGWVITSVAEALEIIRLTEVARPGEGFIYGDSG